MLVALIAVALLALLLATHPFLTYPATLSLVRRWKPAPAPAVSAPGAALPRAALCFCAYNEADVIADKIANLQALRARLPGLAIHCYVDGSTDRTAALLAPHADWIRLTVGAERRGKTHGMNLLVAEADAEIVIFTDANVMIPPEGIPRLLAYFADETVGCVSGHLVYTNPGDSETSRNGALYWRLEERTKRLESETGSMVGADGSLFAIRKRLHMPVPDGIIDDMYLSLGILCGGHRVITAPDVLAYERAATSAGDEFRRKIRIACQAFNVHRLLWPRLRRLPAWSLYKYLSHRLVRWFAIYFLGVAGLALLAAAALLWGMPMALGGAMAVSAGVAFVAAVGWGPARQACDGLLALLGVGLGVVRALRGERFVTWSPAGSVRAAATVRPSSVMER